MNLLVTGAWQGAKQYLPAVEAMGHRVVFMPDERDALPCPPEWIEGVICNALFLHHRIEALSSLRYIQLISAGLDRVPMDYVQAHGIEIRNARGVYSIPMAEFAVGGVLQIYKQSRFFAKNQIARRWEKRRDLTELCGKKICIVGCGSVGSECAVRFRAFGCDVTGVDLYPREDGRYDRMLGMECLDEAISAADVLVLTLPLTNESRGLFGAERLARLRQGAVLVNIARGAVVDTDALIEALPRLGGAVLDVFDPEPLPADSPLWEMENVLITPHNSFVSDVNALRMWNLIQSNLMNTR